MKHTMLIVSALALLSHGTYCEAAEYTEVQPQKVQRRTSYMRDIADLTLGGLLMTTAGMSGYASYQLGRDTYQQTTGLKGIIHDANKTVMSFFNKHVAPQNRYLAQIWPCWWSWYTRSNNRSHGIKPNCTRLCKYGTKNESER